MPNQALEQTRDSVMRHGESFGCELLDLAVRQIPEPFKLDLEMRDRRFVAVHRGGPLDKASHVFLIRWAADCAEEVLHLFQKHSSDERPEKALEIARQWASGSVKTGAAMKASLAAHAAAREATDKAAVAAARAAGQAVATAHAADHSMGSLLYALKAMDAAGLDLNPNCRNS